MRFSRKRFTPSSVRSGSERKGAVLTRNGLSRFSQSQAGMSVRREKLMERYQEQSGKCARCTEPSLLDDAVFLTKYFDSSTLPPVVHIRCRRKYDREQAKNKEIKENVNYE